MKRSVLISAVLILVSTILDAQQGTDTLYLKNGSVVTGDLIRFKGKEEVQIKTSDGLLFSFSASDIDRYVRSKKLMDEKTSQAVLYDFNGWGFGISNSILLNPGGDNPGLSLCLYLSGAYTFKSRNTASFATGFELSDEYHLPLIIDYRYDLIKRNVTPFVYARGGGLIDLHRYDSDRNKGGWIFGFGTGFRWPMSKIESYVSFGYRHIVISYLRQSTIYNPEESRTTYNFNRFETGWGFKF